MGSNITAFKFIPKFNFIIKWNCRTNQNASCCNLPHFYLQYSPSSLFRFSFNCKYSQWKMFNPLDVTGFIGFYKIWNHHDFITRVFCCVFLFRTNSKPHFSVWWCTVTVAVALTLITSRTRLADRQTVTEYNLEIFKACAVT
jgi:hypothetical protein